MTPSHELKSRLPEYQCFKIVRAARVLEINLPRRSLVLAPAFGPSIEVEMTDEFWRRNRVEVGGYYVQYEDGYASYSPAAAFESGYTIINPAERG